MRLAIVFFAVLLFAGRALADDREDRETARKEFAAGQAADKRKAYAEAIEHYKKANELMPHPFAMFNIAAGYEKLGKLRDAATWYEQYLDSSSTKEADRERVNRLLIELRNRPANIDVITNPDGARVIINGLPVGTTPYKAELKGGMHNVTVQKGNERDSKEITIEYGEPVTVQFAFSGAVQTVPTTKPPQPAQPEIRPRPAPRGASGMLIVRGEPYGALVAVDNQPIGTIPLTIPLEPGTHSVRITASGFSAYEQQVQITASGKTPIEIRLPRALGQLDAQAPGAPGATPAQPNRIGYLIGGGAGADARGAGALYQGEFGFRGGKYDLAARIGKVDADIFFVDLLMRWTLTKSRIAPYVGGGYSFVEGGYGYLFIGGLRVDITDGERGGLSLMAESGYRFYSGTISDDGASDREVEGAIVPIMASLLIRYR
jgi:hypothetical protein